MHNKVQKPLRKGSLIDILDYRRHLQRQIGGDKRSFVESYYASDGCKGGREGTAEHRLENEEEDGGVGMIKQETPHPSLFGGQIHPAFGLHFNNMMHIKQEIVESDSDS